jgi:phosphoribosylglycinamide formyltransferase-1
LLNIAVFASHNGSDMQALVDGCKSGRIDGRVSVVVSNNPDAYVLQRAKNEEIDHYCLNSRLYPEPGALDAALLTILDEHRVDLIFLAGYLKKIGQPVLRRYAGRIFNIHPALLPKYGGQGMYGMNVHKAVIEAKEKHSGITIHRADEEYDTGEIVAQTEVTVDPSDTPETLAARILEREHTFLVDVVSDIIAGNIRLG